MSRMCAGKEACIYDNGGCSPNATCTELHPGRLCTCNEGYTGNGYTCTRKYHMRCMYVLIRAPEYGEKYFRPEVEMLSFVRMATQHILRGS